MFADQYPRFLDLSEDPSSGADVARERERQRHRFNERYEALIASNRDILDGARVVDLACHDGRYAFAALQTGAAHATGVEARQSLLDRAAGAFEHYGQDPATYRFVQGDLFEVLARQELQADVVFSFGFLYHTYRHTEFFYRLHQMAPKHLVMDTMVTLDDKPTLKLILEQDTEDNRSAAQDPWSVGRVLVLRPSLPSLELLLASYGFEIESLHDWKGQLEGKPVQPGVSGYATGKRVTVRCRFDKRVRPGARRRVTVPRVEVAHEVTAVPTVQPAAVAVDGWRGRVNRTLAAATGYELRRTPRH